MAGIPRMMPNKLKELLDRGEPVTLIDTRTPDDWGSSDVQLPGAKRLHYSELEARLDEVPREGTIVAYCT